MGRKKLRFGWLDFTDDGKVTQALFAYAQKWGGAGHGMEYMEGPVGFCNLDKAAMLTWGFDELSNTTALYNYPYYPVHMEANGFEKIHQWIESEMKVPDRVPDKIRRFSSLLKRNIPVHPRSEYQIGNKEVHTAGFRHTQPDVQRTGKFCPADKRTAGFLCRSVHGYNKS